MKRACNTCRWWLATDSPEGHCRRRSPGEYLHELEEAAYLVGEQRLPYTQKVRVVSRWPVTRSDDRCIYRHKGVAHLCGLLMESGCSGKAYSPHPRILESKDQVCPECGKPVVFEEYVKDG